MEVWIDRLSDSQKGGLKKFMMDRDRPVETGTLPSALQVWPGTLPSALQAWPGTLPFALQVWPGRLPSASQVWPGMPPALTNARTQAHSLLTRLTSISLHLGAMFCEARGRRCQRNLQDALADLGRISPHRRRPRQRRPARVRVALTAFVRVGVAALPPIMPLRGRRQCPRDRAVCELVDPAQRSRA
eukprot:365592-Chlamydomonas_euryale.AAC.2